MRSAHTVEQVRAAERQRMAQLPAGALMRQAAAGLATAVADFVGHAYAARVLLLVGPGDNGGDALIAGAMLSRRGARVEAVLLADNEHREELVRAGGRVLGLAEAASVRRPDVVVDGLLGIGGRPGLREDAQAAVALFPDVPMVSVDVPSGVEVDTGRLDGPHVTADLTVTFGTLKPCHLVDPAAAACGVVHLVDLGLETPPAPVEALQQDDAAALLPRPAPFDHKYTRGVVGVATGSSTYPGAAVLGVAGANSGLCGMVRYTGGAVDAVHAAHPEVVGDGRVQAWVVGSGGADRAEAALQRALEDGVPVVVDADGLPFVRPGTGTLVLTPHAGEMASLLGWERSRVEADQLEAARTAAQRYAATVLLKGRHTLTVAPDGRTRVTTSGTPWLGTAGAGDVLAGLVGALLATGLEPYDAASLGSWLHGAAADLAGAALRAGDIAEAIPRVVRLLA